MPASLISLNTTVPAPHMPGSPTLVVFDNGDWEIALQRDADYLAERSSGFLCSDSVSNILTCLSLEYDGEEMDETGDEVILFLSITVESDDLEEPVVGIWESGEIDIFERYHAEKMVANKDSGLFNFIPVSDFMEDLRRFLATNRAAMFEEIEDDMSLNFEDAED